MISIIQLREPTRGQNRGGMASVIETHLSELADVQCQLQDQQKDMQEQLWHVSLSSCRCINETYEQHDCIWQNKYCFALSLRDDGDVTRQQWESWDNCVSPNPTRYQHLAQHCMCIKCIMCTWMCIQPLTRCPRRNEWQHPQWNQSWRHAW